MTALHLPNDQRVTGQIPQLTKQVATAGYDGVWFGEVNNQDAVVPAALAASTDTPVEVAAVLNVFTRAPTTIAMTGATLAAAAPGRATIILGVASPLLVRRWNGIGYTRPVDRLADVIRFLRSALAGERVAMDFATFTSSGFSLGQPPEHAPRMLVATTGRRGLALADAEADGVVVNWMSPDDLSRMPGLPSDASRVAMLLQVCPTTDSALVDHLLRPVLTDYLNVPGYADLQRRLGRGPMLEQMWTRFAAGDREGARRALPRDIIDQLVVSGSPADCRARLDDIEQSTGVRVVAVHVVPEPLTFIEAVTPWSDRPATTEGWRQPD